MTGTVFNRLRITGTATLIAASVFLGMPAGAVSVNCPGTPSTSDREFSIDTSPASTCLAFGGGNLSGNPGTDDFLLSAAGAGFVLIDKSDDNTSGAAPNAFANPGGLVSGLSGSFSFTAPAGFTDFVIGFKSGFAQILPTWAVFDLPDGVTSGTWAISGRQALSHANIYAKTSVIPIPAALPLFLTALAGAGLLSRRRRTLV